MAFVFAVEQNGALSSLPPPMQMFLLSEGTTDLHSRDVGRGARYRRLAGERPW